ncbi:RNA ligase-domain-containing protein [Choanephora cucurbitarum]|nr:RNA ligase-domain-containing protein [Choanephora cucurbitarum]
MSAVNIPFLDLDQAHTKDVIERLCKYKQEYPKELRSKEYTLEDGQVWTSWTMRESVYKKKASIFPTMARGFFTQENQRVMARGYDKFFNVFETSMTQWPALASDTEGPYEVTAKENGCIIFISVLSDEKVVVTSKHSIPSVKDDPKAHAGVGYRWLLTHLASVEKSEKDLAQWLSKQDITLVAELCDDEFEEHVLAYVEKDRGLYLHGANYNRVDLHTIPSDTVRQLAEDFGFHKTDYMVLETIEEVKQFSEDMQKTGLFRNREVEGAVVRCKRKGHDFMFKIKNERYLTFREYREVTNQLIETKEGLIRFVDKPNLKITYEKTRFYVDWLRKQVTANPEWFQQYKLQKGIIQVRLAFEDYWEKGQL